MPFPPPQADLSAWLWFGESSSLNLITSAWEVLAQMSASWTSFHGSIPGVHWRLSFHILAISQLWAVASDELRLLDAWARLGGAGWCWLWSSLSVLAGMSMVGALHQALSPFFCQAAVITPQGFSSQPVFRTLANSLGRWERKLEGWGLGGNPTIVMLLP